MLSDYFIDGAVYNYTDQGQIQDFPKGGHSIEGGSLKQGPGGPPEAISRVF